MTTRPRHRCPFGHVLDRLLYRYAMYANDLAEKINVSPTYLSVLKTGKKPVPDHIAHKIAAALKLEPGEQHALLRAAQLITEEKHAAFLRSRGWVCVRPEDLA